ncbi:MAG: AMP-dependent synthetase [Actinobacteria bacterium]|nr:MAG: AMP-dependent synthetase [Actinomycetota bacterium]
MTELAWEPTPEYVERANVTRLMRAHGIETIDELRRRSVEDVQWYWDAAVKDLGIEFHAPYGRVLDVSRGIPWATWFEGGRVNLVTSCVERWAERPETRDQVALIGESETGTVRSLTFAELRAAVDQAAAGLRDAGVGKGDAVAVFMPMIPEAVIAAYATAKIGAIYLPIFSGFAPSAVAARLQDAQVKLVFTADGTWRRGKQALMKDCADEAAAASPSVERMVVLSNLGVDVPMTPGRDVGWSEFVAPHEGARVEAEDTAAEDVFMIAYTSGTTGRPKGAVHVHGGFLVKIASECAYQTDIHTGEVFYWFTDMGWIMGPLSMVGAHASGAAMVMYEGAPDFPDPSRIWASVERHRVAMLGVSPTLIRALRSQGDEWPAQHDLSSLRILGSTGEPWNPEPYRWLQRVAGGGRIPIINLSGGTEVGACFLSPFPVEPIKVCSLGGASLGMDVDVFDADGRPVRGEVGELVCKQPWPGMTRGIWGDPERYIETYWSTYEGVWRHGDWAKIDEDGQWFLLGRSDDTINVAGKRLGPAEVESVLVGHPLVIESAVVGVPDATKGEAVWCFVVAPGADGEDALPDELADLVATELGRPFKPSRVVLVEALPKTRSAKILRRAVRAVAAGEDPGDMSSAENPQALDAIRAALD